MTPDSNASQQTGESGSQLLPEQFAQQMRQRAEEAIAASVHHASLSQQYLALSQKFAALAEQAGRGGVLHQSNIAASLEAEASSGQPAPPIGIPQPDIAIPAFHQTHSTPTTTAHDFQPKDPGPARKSGHTFAPPASEASHTASSKGTRLPTETLQPGTKPAAKSATRRKRKKPRELAERFRLMAPMLLERVRVRAKKSDLKPQPRSATEEIRKSRSSVAVSVLLFSGLIVVLSMLQLQFDADAQDRPIIASFSDTIAPPEEEDIPVEQPLEDPGDQQETPVEEPSELPEPEPEPLPQPEEPEPEPQDPAPADPLPEDPTPEMQPSDIPATESMADTPAPAVSSETTTKIDGRSSEGRKAMLQKYGGSAASESAVGLALEWLASRQRKDGSWDFIDVGACSHPGTVNNPIGGTAYALLPFLAAGQTHRDKDATYRKNVEAGLNYLMSVGVRTQAGYDLRGVLNKGDKDNEPNEAYYVHGAATLALCEAYGMTSDRRLKPAAEGAILFLINSQDPRGGGWRYLPQQPGSTSVTAIQLMALMAARKAGIKIPGASLQGVMHYLDSVQVDQQGRYGYEVEKKSYQASITAMALLCRMYLGWGRDDGDMREGVALLDKRGPYDNLYYNYFATQVMRNIGGEEWNRWNERLRDDLISWQETEGEAKGSWPPRDRADYSRSGGRLLTTCLATLTLQVYYRYEPLLPEPLLPEPPGQ